MELKNGQASKVDRHLRDWQICAIKHRIPLKYHNFMGSNGITGTFFGAIVPNVGMANQKPPPGKRS